MRRAPFVTAAFTILLFSGSALAQGDRGTVHQRTRTVPPAEQHQRIQQQQQRATQYQQQLGKQIPNLQQQTSQLLQQRRTAQYKVQQQYAAQLQQQQQRLRTPRNYASDPYVTAPATYRYRVGSVTRETNQYGANVLRSAVSAGYQQGFNAGRADRQDRRSSGYQSLPAYVDATYGYDGNYVDQSDYSYYFRQGFQRGYQDGYGSRVQYGTVSNGSYSILGSVLSSILGLQSL